MVSTVRPAAAAVSSFGFKAAAVPVHILLCCCVTSASSVARWVCQHQRRLMHGAKVQQAWGRRLTARRHITAAKAAFN